MGFPTTALNPAQRLGNLTGGNEANEQPGGDHNLGGKVATPAFSKMAGDIMRYLHVPPTRPGLAQVATR